MAGNSLENVPRVDRAIESTPGFSPELPDFYNKRVLFQEASLNEDWEEGKLNTTEAKRRIINRFINNILGMFFLF